MFNWLGMFGRSLGMFNPSGYEPSVIPPSYTALTDDSDTLELTADDGTTILTPDA